MEKLTGKVDVALSYSHLYNLKSVITKTRKHHAEHPGLILTNMWPHHPAIPYPARPGLQEFRLHGVQWRGPCKSLQQAGCKGKYTSNVQRDMLRKVSKKDPSQASFATGVF